MSNLAGAVGKKVLTDRAQTYFKNEDAFYEQYQSKNWLGRPKMKRRKKHAPPGLSKNDQQVYKKVRGLAHTLDEGLFNCCGIKVGWGAIIGLLPGAGDLADGALALNVMRHCGNIDGGLPASVHARMQLNIIIDFCVGLVPLVGDVIDAVYKCNTRNFLLLEKVLKKRGEENLRRLAAGETETVPPDVQHQLQQQYPSSADVEMGHGRPQTQRTVSPKSHQGNANSRAASRGPSRNVSRNRQNGATSRSQSPARPPVPGHDPPQQDAGFGQPGYGKGYA